MSPWGSAASHGSQTLHLQDHDASVRCFPTLRSVYPGCLTSDKSLNHCQLPFLQLSDRIYAHLTSEVAGKNEGERHEYLTEHPVTFPIISLSSSLYIPAPVCLKVLCRASHGVARGHSTHLCSQLALCVFPQTSIFSNKMGSCSSRMLVTTDKDHLGSQ